MVEIDANGMTIYSVEKIRLKKEDILMFVFPGRLHPEQLKYFQDNLPIELKEKSKKWLLDNNYDLEIY